MMFKPQLLAITIAITGSALAGSTLAQTQDGEQLERKKPPRTEMRDRRARDDRGSVSRLLRRMDTNDDELISLEEYIGAGISGYSQAFTRADQDDDGYVTAQELKPARRGDRQQPDNEALQTCLESTGSDKESQDERFSTADTNGDGALSQDEFFAMLEQGNLDRFNALDSDGDQQLTADEIQASRQARNEARRAQRDAMRTCMKEQRDLAQ